MITIKQGENNLGEVEKNGEIGERKKKMENNLELKKFRDATGERLGFLFQVVPHCRRNSVNFLKLLQFP